MQITASNAPRNDALDARSRLALVLLTILGLALTIALARHFRLFMPATPVAAVDGSLTITTGTMDYSMETIRVQAGESPNLQLANNGFLPHSFDVDELNIHLQMPARQSVTAGVDGLPAGTYTFYCAVPGHREAGMVGTLIVE